MQLNMFNLLGMTWNESKDIGPCMIQYWKSLGCLEAPNVVGNRWDAWNILEPISDRMLHVSVGIDRESVIKCDKAHAF